MRFRGAVIFVVWVAFLLIRNVSLAGNVLLPPDNGNNGSLPNLGLMPAESPPTETNTAETPDKDKPPAPVVAAAPAIPPAPLQPATKATPSPAKPPAPVTDPSSPSYNLTINLVPTSIWTPNDISTISTQLGIPSALVRSECQFGVNGMLITDHGTVAVDSNQSTTVNVTYDGSVTNALLSSYAACSSAPKPAPYTYIQKMGDKFSVSLGSAFCAPATPFAGTKQKLLITHTVTGNDTCVYQ